MQLDQNMTAPGITAKTDGSSFFASLPTLDSFHALADPGVYTPIPNDWMIGVSDVVASTEAIKAGRYKAVNLAGAAVISAVSNALGTLDFPYVFAGDGMCYAVPQAQAKAARDALAASTAWVGHDLQLTLRAGEIPVAAIRATGRDVRVARFAPSPDAVYAMFSGGGLVWAEDELKAGRLTVVPPDSSRRPDLSGLSCRFRPVKARNGLVLSLIVAPRHHAQDASFRTLVSNLLEMIDTRSDAALPLRSATLPLPWPPGGFGWESRLQRKDGQSGIGSTLAVGARNFASALIMWAGRDVGRFSPTRYRADLVANSDHRKFEDRLMMTIDCSAEAADAIELMLSKARDAGTTDFGLHRQDSALITCVVPSPMQRDHVHFIDGAAGGYALAAVAMKRSLRDRKPEAISPLAPQAVP